MLAVNSRKEAHRNNTAFAPRRFNRKPSFGQGSQHGKPVAFQPRFAANGDCQEFNTADRQTIQTVLNQCTYGKDLEQLLADPAVKASFTPWKFQIAKYQMLDITGVSRKGVCHELAFSVGKHLQKHFGHRYVFVIANGQCPRYFNSGRANHMYLLGWPQERDNHFRHQLRMHPGTLPSGALLIDPSFKTQGIVGESVEHRDYKLISHYDLDRFYSNDPDDLKLTIAYDQIGSGTVPLGFMTDLVPQADPADREKLLMLSIKWLSKENKPEPAMSLYPGPASTGVISAPDVLAKLDPKTLLGRFYAKIRADLGLANQNPAVKPDKPAA